MSHESSSSNAKYFIMIQNIKAELAACEEFFEEVHESGKSTNNSPDWEYSAGMRYVINRIRSRIND